MTDKEPKRVTPHKHTTHKHRQRHTNSQENTESLTHTHTHTNTQSRGTHEAFLKKLADLFQHIVGKQHLLAKF